MREWRLDRIPPEVFRAAQAAMLAKGDGEDPCGACGCRRKRHVSAPTFSYAKSGGSSGKSIEIPVQAPTSCDCKYCFCFCVAFVEPFPGQPLLQCQYEPAKPQPKVQLSSQIEFEIVG